MSERRQGDRRRGSVAVSTERRDSDRRNTDRRGSTRVPLDLWVEEEKGDELYFRRTGNLSQGGVYFEQTIPHTLGTRVKLRFALPGESHVIEAMGEIVNTPGEKDGLGMGLKFVDLTDEDRTRLDTFIERAG
jgi:uncharacterized protein (TIGR02266 family)